MLQVAVWRLALGRTGGAGAGAALVWPLALVERRGARDHWRLVPDPTLAFALLGLAAVAWAALAPGQPRVRPTRVSGRGSGERRRLAEPRSRALRTRRGARSRER